jgi:uncharacterized repeat protein (TIGR03803 family)
MKNALQHRDRISGVRLASTALTLATMLLWTIITAQSARAQLTVLTTFGGTNCNSPQAPLVQGTDGNLYGTTVGGGVNGKSGNTGDGTIFKISPTGTVTTLYSFCQKLNCTDGDAPFAGLVQASNGNFYGTTYYGDANSGTIFEMTPSGTVTTLHSFDGTDGLNPGGGLVQGTDGNLYGATRSGGANGLGTFFTITLTGTLTTLHSFDTTDGIYPDATLVQGTNGDFYGTTAGGNDPAVTGTFYGTVFKITSTGTLTKLYSFCSLSGCADGAYPVAGLIQATSGNFYGTTFGNTLAAQGTCSSGNCGTVFMITPAGKLTTLYTFCTVSGCTDGANPSGALMQATNGDFYGTTQYGGTDIVDCADGCGTVFRLTPGGKISPDGKLTTLDNFDTEPNGGNPYSALVQDTNGNFYGATSIGGAIVEPGVPDDGEVFSLSVGLKPFVALQTTSGEVGAAVTILGTDLTGATSVTFNGTAATFTVVSSSEITTTVPEGATTGKIEVNTPSGTLTSNVKFRVKA